MTNSRYIIWRSIASADEIDQMPSGRFTHQRDFGRIDLVLGSVLLHEYDGALYIFDGSRVWILWS